MYKIAEFEIQCYVEDDKEAEKFREPEALVNLKDFVEKVVLGFVTHQGQKINRPDTIQPGRTVFIIHS